MELIYLRSPTGQQHERAKRVLDAIRSTMPELTIREVDPADDPGYAERFKIKYAPGLIVDGRIEFVGIPREKMLLERLQLLAQATFRPPLPVAGAPATAPAGVSPEERQRRIEEAKRRAEEAKRQREAAGQAVGTPSPVPASPSPGPAAPPPISPEERQRKIEEARKKAEEIKKQREAAGGS